MTNATTNVLILGAAGGIARVATDLFLRETDAHLTLYLRDRDARRLERPASHRVRVVEGDVLDTAQLTAAMAGHSQRMIDR
jgi:NAD(P)-dependent dehydrogenase (short-subunit alcohol dehydrogenase family)